MRLMAGLFLALILLMGGMSVVKVFAAAAEEQVDKPLDQKKLLAPRRNASGTVEVTPFFDNPIQWAADQQRNFSTAMTNSLKEMSLGSEPAAAYWLMVLSFFYGIFHAAGPGHGKAIITSWLLATENDLKRGLLIAGLSALFQALTAIIAVSLLLTVFKAGSLAVKNATNWLEQASYAMIAAMGLYLTWTAFKPHQHHEHKHDHHRHDDHEQGRAPHHCNHAHQDHHNHSHAPEPKQLRGEWSLARALSLAFAVGIRPCTGAILVLVASNLMGLYWAGIASTFAMGLGVFLTIAAIAAISVHAKQLALKLAANDDKRLAQASFVLRLLGGITITGLGTLMFLGALRNGIIT